MTETAPIVVRHAQPASAPAAVASGIANLGGQLPEVLQLCNAIAGAGDLIPRAYRDKPGAVLLAKMWADKHGVDVFTAIQNIDVIDGKTWVKTQMRIELAVDRGFEFRVTETTREVCTVEVWYGSPLMPKRLGDPITARFDDRPRPMKYPKSGAPTPWALHPDDMLFAEACRKADRRYVRTAAGMLDAEHDYIEDETPDLVETLTGTEIDQEPPAEVADVDEAPATETPPAAEEQQETAITEDELRDLAKRKKVKLADVLRMAEEATFADIIANGKAKAAKAWIETGQ